VASLQWREDAPSDLVLLAVAKCLTNSGMDRAKWMELALITGTRDAIQNHPRLLRSLDWGDADHPGTVHDVVPWILGDVTADPWYPLGNTPSLPERYKNLAGVSQYLGLPEWLVQNEPELANKLLGSDTDALLPDGTVLSEVEAAAGRLGVAEMRRQVDRIRRDHGNDAEALIGHVKELVESTCKTILGLTGDGPETRDDVPALVTQTLIHLGLHPSNVEENGDDPAQLNAIKRLFGGLNSILIGAAELRNRRGGGHGRSGAPVANDSVARLTAGMVLAAVLFLCEAYEERISAAFAYEPGSPDAPRLTHEQVQIGSVVNHPTFGIGAIVTLANLGENFNATVRFTQHGDKRLLMRHAPLVLVRY
jgi:hypothetical protein